MTNKELRQKWLDALRSGEYEQGRDYLHIRDCDGHKYCATGVLADVLGAAWVLERSAEEDWWAFDVFRPDRGSMFGLDSGYVEELDLGREIDAATSLNDRGDSFHQIADYLELLWRSDE